VNILVLLVQYDSVVIMTSNR